MTTLKLLNETAYPIYRLEYNDFYSSHIAHGIIALDKLGADEARIRQFVDKTAKILVKETDPLTSGPIDDVRGKRKNFPQVYDHYKKLSEKMSMDDLLRSELPKLLDGLAASLFHPLIQIGYGYNVKSLPTVVEGLAYLYYADFPLNSNVVWTGKGQDSLLDVMKDLANDEALKFASLGDLGREKSEGFMKRLYEARDNNLALHTVHGDRIMSYVQRLGFSKQPASRDEMVKFAFDAATYLYITCSVRNEFFILHGMTASWALKQIIHLLPSDKSLLRAISKILGSLFCGYLAFCKAPTFNDSIKVNSGPATEDWKSLRDRAVAMDTDEHVYKIVQVTEDMTKQFPEQGGMYQQAAILTLEQKLSIHYKTQEN